MPNPAADKLKHSSASILYRTVPILYNGLAHHPSKVHLHVGNLDPHLIHGSLGPWLKLHLYQFNHLCTAHWCSQYTDAQTTLCAMSIVYSNRVHVCNISRWSSLITQQFLNSWPFQVDQSSLTCYPAECRHSFRTQQPFNQYHIHVLL